MTLEEIYHKHKQVINGITWPDFFETHSYGEIYSEILAPYRTTAKNILEIGIFGGQRLRVWEEYFSGKVYGVDCSETPVDGMADLRPMIAEGTHNIHIFDATDATEVEKRFKDIKFDVIIDDAAHDIEQQLQLYSIFKSRMTDFGIYIIEDVQDIDATKQRFLSIDRENSKAVKILDLRHKKGRYDDVLVIIK